jgi:cyanate lyase
MTIIGHNHSFTNVNSLSAEQKRELKKTIQDLNDSMTRVQAEKELQKEAIDAIAENLNLDKKMVRRLAKVYFKANFNEESEENKTFEEFYQLIVAAT